MLEKVLSWRGAEGDDAILGQRQTTARLNRIAAAAPPPRHDGEAQPGTSTRVDGLRRFSRATLAALTAAVLTACATVGPEYVQPELPASPELEHAGDIADVSEPPVADFWKGFDDPLLAGLVEGALEANHDLRAALGRLDQVRALARLSRFDRTPTVTAGGGYTESRASLNADTGIPAENRDTQTYDAGFDAFWELDLFGRVLRSVEAAHAEADAAAADLRALQVSIAAEVARGYFELRGIQEQLRVARANADNQAETLALTESRLDAGSGTELDVARARAQLTFTRSRIPALEAAMLAAAHRLAVLNGREPAAFLAELETPGSEPDLPEAVAVGTPAELLRRRPDILAAERRLASATARIGVATADLFPRVTFNGSFGFAASDLGDLFTSRSETYAFGPSISWAFLDVGRVRARIAASDADAETNLALYEGTVLRALEETENALVAYSRAQLEGEQLKQSAEASTTAAVLARRRYEGGAADFLQVLDAERTLLDAEDRLAQSRTRTATALVAVYKAVAGGWPERIPSRDVAAEM